MCTAHPNDARPARNAFNASLTKRLGGRVVHLGVENAAGPDRHWREQLQAPGREAREAGAGYIADRLMTDTVKEAKKTTVPARERFTQ